MNDDITEPGAGIGIFWLFAGAVVIPLLFVLDAFIYYPALLASGTLSPDADAIGIPIGQALASVPFNIPILLLYALPAVYRYGGNGQWLAMDRSRPWRLALSILLYVPPPLFILGERSYAVAQGTPLYEHSILVVSVPLAIWCLALRAAMAAPRRSDFDLEIAA